MHLSASSKMNSGEPTVHHEAERWNLNLCHVYIYFFATMDARYRSPIYDWEVQLGCQQAIYATFGCAAINQSMLPCNGCLGSWDRPSWSALEIRIESNVYLNRWTVGDKENRARRSRSWIIDEPAVGLWHIPIYTSPRLVA
jgi:hypothetical protein